MTTLAAATTKDDKDKAREPRETGTPLLTIYNRHIAAAGTPPQYTNEEPGQAFSYFENTLGKQWVYVFDLATRRGVVRGGDADWGRSHEVLNGTVASLVLNEAELLWVRACWLATNGR